MKIENGITPMQFIIHLPATEAGDKLRIALASIGGVKSHDPSNRKIKGWTKYGLNKVQMTLDYIQVDDHTVVTVTAKSGSIQSSPVTSAINRLKDALVNSDNSGYVADRKGTSNAVIAGSLGLLVLGILLVFRLLGSF